MDAPDRYQTTYDSKTKTVVFYSLTLYSLNHTEPVLDNVLVRIYKESSTAYNN